MDDKRFKISLRWAFRSACSFRRRWLSGQRLEDQDAGDFPFENRKLRKARSSKLSGPSAGDSLLKSIKSPMTSVEIRGKLIEIDRNPVRFVSFSRFSCHFGHVWPRLRPATGFPYSKAEAEKAQAEQADAR